MAMGSESKIDTKLFVATAESISGVHKELDSCFAEWTKIMQGLRGNWHGDTSDDVKNVVDAVQNSAGVLFVALGGYRKALYELAGIYDNTEKKLQETSKSLKFTKNIR